MRVLLWHGWLLGGSGSNVATAKVAEVLRRMGHDVLLLCQEQHPERHSFVDVWGAIGADGPSGLRPNGAATTAPGRVRLVRPEIGSTLPVFVLDDYEGFSAKRFVDLSEDELGRYLERNVKALRAATAWHQPDVVVTGHAVPGAVIGTRALGPGRHVAKIHGSDLEYAIRIQARYRTLAEEGLTGSRAIVGGSRDVLERLLELVPDVRDRVHVVSPGVDREVFHPMPRSDALNEAARRLRQDPATARGRPNALDEEVGRALEGRDARALDRLAAAYDQDVPDLRAADRVQALAGSIEPLVGYIGKLIPQKGVELFIQAVAGQAEAAALAVGFGTFREWLVALTMAIHEGDHDAVAWLAGASDMQVEWEPGREPSHLRDRLWFTGRLDHRYAPFLSAAFDIQVVPSKLAEAFGMVAAEAAAAGALPLVARHSGLGEVSSALEAHVGRPGLFSFEPGPGAVGRLTEHIRSLLELPAAERSELRSAVSEFGAATWSWERTAEGLLRLGIDP
jgi:glycosyltransferase involved in cell wall biosynthesis